MSEAAFAAQAALVAILEAVTGLADYIPPAGMDGRPVEFPAKGVWVEDTIDGWTLSTSLTNGFTAPDSSFTLHGDIYEQMLGATASEARTRMDTVLGLVAAAIRAAPTLSGTVSQAVITSASYSCPFADSECVTRAPQMRFDVTCQCW